jgi:hypothetical protein
MPSSPRSLLEQISALLRMSAGVVSRFPFWKTRNCPPWVVINNLPSGVKAIAVGAPTFVTKVFWMAGGGGGGVGVGAGICCRELVIQPVRKGASIINGASAIMAIRIRVRTEISLLCVN